VEHNIHLTFLESPPMSNKLGSLDLKIETEKNIISEKKNIISVNSDMSQIVNKKTNNKKVFF